MSDKKIILGIKAKNNIKMNALPPSLSLTDVERAEKAAETAVAQAAIAVEKASEASLSAKNAVDSENNAVDSEIMAKKWAQSTESPDGTLGNKSAKTWAEEAADSAKSAADNASIAVTKATESATSASQASSAALTADNGAATATNAAKTATTKANEAVNAAAEAHDSAETAFSSADSALSSAEQAEVSASNAAKSAQEAAQIAGSIGNPVVSVTATNGVITVEQSDGNRNTIDTIANATQATNDKNGNDISTTYLPNNAVGNEANKVPKYNNSGHLVFPDGSEMWVG